MSLPSASDAARALQLLGAAAIRGTPAARERASKAARAVSPEAAHLRARKAAAARHGLPWPLEAIPNPAKVVTTVVTPKRRPSEKPKNPPHC